MELAIHNIKGKDTGRKAKLSKNIFAIEPNDHAIYLDVKPVSYTHLTLPTKA